MRSSATTATGVFPPRDHHLPALGTAGAPQDRRHNEQGGAQQQQSVPNNGKFGFHDENVVEGLRAELRQYREDTRGMLRQKDEALEQLMGRMDRKDEALERMRKEHREEMNKKDEALQKLMDKKDEALERLRRESLETHEKLRQEHREDLNRLLQAGQVMPATQNQQHQPSSWPQRVESSVERLAQQPAMPSTSSAAAPSPHQRRVKQAALTTQRRSSHTPSLATVSAAAFVTQLKDGGDGAEATLVDALEVGLEVLEALATSLPRKQRKAIKELCRRVEAKLEQVDEDLLGRLAAYEAADLARLGESLAAVQALQAAADIGVECVGVVAGTLDELGRIGDVVTGARQQLVSNETNMRMRGIDALRNLPRVLLPEPAAAEVAAASLVETMLVDEGKTDGERAGAGWALFALGLRNGAAAVDVLEKSLEGIWLKVHFEACDGRLQGREGAAVVVVAHGCNFLAGTMGELYPVVRARIETALLTCVSQFVANAAISKSRYQELLSHLIEATTAEDIAEASAAVKVLDPFMFLKSGPECIGAFLKSDPVRVWWEVRRRVVEPGAPAARWREIAQTLSMDTVCLALLQQLINETAAFFMAAIPHDGLWPKIIAEHVHLANVNWEAKISAQDRGSNFAFKFTNIVEKAAQDPAHHPALMPCAEALLWLTANSCPFIGQDIADEAAAACVSLLGKNEKEGGLTLDKNAIDRVLLVVHRYFDTSPNADLWTLQAAREKDGNKVAAKIQLIVDMVIADANKLLVLEHPHVLDDLVAALLLDEANLRRGNAGAETLQATSAQALENLALSEVGKPALRAHKGVMEGLRAVQTKEALSEEARRSASAALFELDEAARQKTKQTAKKLLKERLRASRASGETSAGSTDAVDGADGDDDDANTKHVMLSYNWSHQSVIKRINTALKTRAYAVWIDIEKMQGSTVEAMSAAVEGAAVMCYGISRAYKESANCRLEAQYAYQQKLDMVPLMMEDGYHAKGWLGMLLGVRLWYGFYGSVLESEAAFEGKVDELCRELGEKGKP